MTFALTHAHTHDPATSHDAAAKAQGLAARHKAIILNQLHLTNTRYGHGLTSNEITERCELDYLQVVRRMKDLCDDGKVVDTGTRRASPGGRKAAVWGVV